VTNVCDMETTTEQPITPIPVDQIGTYIGRRVRVISGDFPYWSGYCGTEGEEATVVEKGKRLPWAEHERVDHQTLLVRFDAEHLRRRCSSGLSYVGVDVLVLLP
jgi:hypothetical protein